MAGFRLFEVLRLGFAYEDDPSVVKERPAVVVGRREASTLLLVAKVTGHGPRLEFPGEVRLVDWQAAGLPKPSTVRCSKVIEVDTQTLEPIHRYGVLSERDELAVRRGLVDAGIAQG